MADYADALAGLVTALDLRRVHLCGLSFGGGLALAVYRRHPQLVRSLVLASAYAGWRGSLPPADVEVRLARARAELDAPPAEWIDSYLPGFFARPVPPETLDLVRSIMLEVRSAGTRPMLAAFAEADLRACYRPSPCPPCCSTAPPTYARRARLGGNDVPRGDGLRLTNAVATVDGLGLLRVGPGQLGKRPIAGD